MFTSRWIEVVHPVGFRSVSFFFFESGGGPVTLTFKYGDLHVFDSSSGTYYAEVSLCCDPHPGNRIACVKRIIKPL